MTAGAAQPDGAEFVERFAAAWADPSLGGHEALWHPSVRLVQPMAPTTTGLEASREHFARLFELIPDLRAEVDEWSGGGTTVFIELTLSWTFGARPIRWRAVDRFELVDGLIAERVSYFDSLPLALTILARPRGRWRWWSSGLRPRSRAD